jgi:hypothetical protein
MGGVGGGIFLLHDVGEAGLDGEPLVVGRRCHCGRIWLISL